MTSDVAQNFVRNEASATAGDGTVSNTDVAVIPSDGTYDYDVVKELVTPGQTFAALGETVDFRITVTNTGSLTINRDTTGPVPDDIDIVDPDTTIVPGFGNCVEPAPLFTQDSGTSPSSYSCVRRYTITQADIDAGFYTNTVVADGSFRQGDDQLERTDTATVQSAVTPGFTFAKTSTDDFAAVGDLVSYTFTVTNTSPQTITSVTVTDPLIPALSCTLSNIGPAPASQSCIGQYSVTQADLDAGEIVNTASATATTPTGVTLTETDDETVEIDPAAATRTLALTKTPSSATFTGPNEAITYTFGVENTGNLTLRDVVVRDTDLGLTCAIPSIAPGATDTSCTAARSTTQADFDTGSYRNDATATATGVTPDADDAAFATITATGPARVATFDFEKTATAGFSAVGDLVDFTLAVENTGGVTLTNVVLSDPFFDPDLTCTIGSLAPGARDESCVGTYTVVQADIDRGSIVNDASLAGNGLDGAPISATDDVTVPGPAEATGLVVAKAEIDGSGGFGNLPATETYGFTVRNTGNVTLTAPTITDPLTGYTCALADLAPGATATTCADGTPLRTTYTVDQDDIDAAEIENTVTVTSTTDRGTPVTASDTLALPGPAQLPALSLVKTATSGDPFDAVGDTVAYDYLVTNEGNVTLTQRSASPTTARPSAAPRCPPAGWRPARRSPAPRPTPSCRATSTRARS